MKKTIIYIYAALMVLTLIGLAIFTFFKAYNAIFCEVSLFVSLLFSLAIVASKIDPVFKISLMIVGSAIAIVTYFLSMFMPNYLGNNVALFIFMALIFVEVIALSGAKLFSKFA